MTHAPGQIKTAKGHAMRRFRPRPSRFALAGALILTLGRAAAAGSPLDGEYVCAYGCRATDANPTLVVHGKEADCMNEFGGLFRGKLLSATSVACFRQTGMLGGDGTTLTWTNGVIWKRHGPLRN
jgi:hypothetical protein